MKKTHEYRRQKLRLSRETLRNLEAADIEKVGGGVCTSLSVMSTIACAICLGGGIG